MSTVGSVEITVTQAAQDYIRQIAPNNALHPIHLSFGLKKSGCSGFAYVFDFDRKPDGEAIFLPIAPDMVLGVAKQDAPFLHGTVIDYEAQTIGGVMRFRNPNEKASCGCGESVAFTDDESAS